MYNMNNHKQYLIETYYKAKDAHDEDTMISCATELYELWAYIIR